MAINIAILKEPRIGEKRVAMAPGVVPRVTRLGATLAMESGAGTAATFADAVTNALQNPALMIAGMVGGSAAIPV